MNTFIYVHTCDQNVSLLLTITHTCCQLFSLFYIHKNVNAIKAKNICSAFDSSPMTYIIAHQVLVSSKILLESTSFSPFLLALHNFSHLNHSKSFSAITIHTPQNPYELSLLIINLMTSFFSLKPFRHSPIHISTANLQ